MKLIICLTMAALIAYVDSHARLADPVNRGSLWRIDEDQPETEEFEWCSDPDPEESDIRKAKCGICGPIYNNDPKNTLSLEDDGDGFSVFLQSFERESPLYTGRIVKTYKKGSVIQATIEVKQKILSFLTQRLDLKVVLKLLDFRLRLYMTVALFNSVFGMQRAKIQRKQPLMPIF